MVRQRRRDTAPEVAIRRLLFAQGFRYRVDATLPSMRRRADLLFKTARIAVFVDGCFWHGCPEHGTRPKSNAAWWAGKLDRNIQRDRDTDQRLVADGWTVVRIWEHEPPASAAVKIAGIVQRLVGEGAASPRPSRWP
jgi:DNA mismatch endonuclease (patch repair protein)